MFFMAKGLYVMVNSDSKTRELVESLLEGKTFVSVDLLKTACVSRLGHDPVRPMEVDGQMIRNGSSDFYFLKIKEFGGNMIVFSGRYYLA
jgi:hypothetical protein